MYSAIRHIFNELMLLIRLTKLNNWPLHAVYQYLAPILSPVTENFLLLNKGRGEKIHDRKDVPNVRVDFETSGQ